MHKIEVPYIDQSVKYPTGCESVSAVMLLKYLGYEMTVDEFIKNTNTDDNTADLDKSFFTSSMSFGNKDFEELSDIKTSLKKNNILISILVFISLVIVITGVLFLLHNIK